MWAYILSITAVTSFCSIDYNKMALVVAVGCYESVAFRTAA